MADNPSQQQQVSNAKSASPLGRKFTLAVCMLLLIAMACFWLLSSANTGNLMQKQADSLGQSMASQTAVMVTELVLANDLVSLNVVLGDLTQGTSIIEAEVVNVDGQIIAAAQADAIISRSLLPFSNPSAEELTAQYSAPINLADSVAGSVILRFDTSYIHSGNSNNLLFVSVATLLLIVIAYALINTYFQYLIRFPLAMLSHTLANIRKGEVENCAEPNDNNEVRQLIQQYNATAEHLAQNSFIKKLHNRLPADAADENPDSAAIQSEQGVTLLVIRLANYQYLASTQQEKTIVNLLNRFYFYAEKAAQLYGGTLSFCSEGEVIVHFHGTAIDEDQAFYAVCAGQLFLNLVEDICNSSSTEMIPCKFKLAAHSGESVPGLYSPLTPDIPGIMGKTLDLVRQVCNECPDNFLLLTETCYKQAGAETRVSAARYSSIDDDQVSTSFLSRDAMPGFIDLLIRQANQIRDLLDD